MPEKIPKLSLHDWVALHSSLLEEERKAEVAAAQTQIEGVPLKNLEARGIVLRNLVITERSTGLYGRPLFTLVPARKDATLPANNFSSGDIVGVCESRSEHTSQITTGVVTYVSQSSIRFVVDDGADELDTIGDDIKLHLHKLCNDVTYKRIKSGLVDLDKQINGPASHLVSVLFGETLPRSPVPSLPPQLTLPNGKLALFNKNLDNSQVEAVQFAIQRSDIAVIHGPPGTGKTTTLVEIIKQHVKLKSKILACAPSNLAVDNLVERLATSGIRLVRLGHPARVTQLTQRHTLDAILHNSEESKILEDIRRDISSHLGQLKGARDKGKRQYLQKEIKLFRKELRERESRLVQQVLLSCDVILATLTSSSNGGPLKHLPPQHLDLVIIDECSQAIEAACYLSLLRAPKLIIAGDHCQLPPTIVSAEAAAKGLEHSLMERVIDQCGEGIVRMLTVQYRMNTQIMEWASSAMYQNRLVASPSVASHILQDLKGVHVNEDTENVLVLIDTAGCECWELDTSDDQSKGNVSEAIIVTCQVKSLVSSGVPENDIAVITPYNLQVELVRSLLRDTHPAIEVRSVDGFQGREKEAVVISLVRSNKQGTVGFLSEDRRLNVAVTRARRHLTVVCDSDTVNKHDFLKGLVDYISQHGQVRTALEFQHELETTEVNTPECIVWNEKPQKKEKLKQLDPKPKRDKIKECAKRELPSEEENIKRRKEYEALINTFLKSSDHIYKFPPTVNSFERRLIHEICENLHLHHESQGEGKERHIVIWKSNEMPESNQQNDTVKNKAETSNQKKEYKDIINGFLKSSKENFEFSCDLNSFERNLIHEICDEYDLHHESQGEGKKRHIIVHKKNGTVKQRANKEECKEMPTEIKEKDKTQLLVLQAEEPCQDSSAKNGAIPKCKLPESSCTKVRTRYVGGKYEEVVVPVEKVRTRYIGGKYEEVAVPVDDKSSSSGCKTTREHEVRNVSDTLTRHCCSCGKDIIKQNYLIHSAQCGKKMKGETVQKAKQKITQKNNSKKGSNLKSYDEAEDFDSLIEQFTKMITKEGVLYPGSGIPSKKPGEAQRKQMHRKLEKKMEEFSKQRQAKKPSKNAKKE
ncbi:DNA-binding protein SMUBP-2 isoform X2 [Cherax quadricarinatus]|uniref:DNA-binding protein SMUBP-2 isoform X2 n=1 Tax=Cherax quadricarinatus TaxID=27406 RepID=UPI002378AA43|nr:DNA-binding protein SMUBP-2-like isoform X2 [Cherax quadricarinatus]